MRRGFAGAVLVTTCAWAGLDFARRVGDALASGEWGIEIAIALQGGLLLLDGVLLAGWFWRGHAPTGRDLARMAWVPLLALVAASGTEALSPAASPSWLARAVFFATLEAGVACWLAGSRRGVWPGRAGVFDVVAVNALAGLLLLEAGLVLASRLAPSPWFSARAPAEALAAARPVPGTFHFGERLQSGGYFDDPFEAPDSDTHVVAVLADSFGLGVVPRDDHFVQRTEDALRASTDAETAARRVRLHNFGIPGIGLAEHAIILEEEALGFDPVLVVLCVFVGNDIHEGNRFGDPERRRRYALQEWVIFGLVARVSAWFEVDARDRRSLSSLGRSPGAAGAVATALDPEQATLSPARFRAIERHRFGLLHRDDPAMRRAWFHFFAGLEWFHERLGPRLLVVLIPDEFQVNDALFRELSDAEGLAGVVERAGPQRRILEFCEHAGIDCLDLLPVLRRAERGGRTYQLRDTHWNARGNAVVATELEPVLARKLGLSVEARGKTP